MKVLRKWSDFIYRRGNIQRKICQRSKFLKTLSQRVQSYIWNFLTTIEPMILFFSKVCLLIKIESDMLQANKNLKASSQRVQALICYLLTAIQKIDHLIWLDLQTCSNQEINVPEKSGFESFVSNTPIQHLWFEDIYSKKKVYWQKKIWLIWESPKREISRR